MAAFELASVKVIPGGFVVGYVCGAKNGDEDGDVNSIFFFFFDDVTRTARGMRAGELSFV